MWRELLGLAGALHGAVLVVESEIGVTLAIGVGLGLLAGQWLDGLISRGIGLTLIDALVALVNGIKDGYSVSSSSEQTRAEWPEEEPSQSGADASQRRNTD